MNKTISDEFIEFIINEMQVLDVEKYKEEAREEVIHYVSAMKEAVKHFK